MSNRPSRSQTTSYDLRSRSAAAYALALLWAGGLAWACIAPSASGEPDAGQGVMRGETVGPWGKLEYYRVILEPPITHLWDGLYGERSYWNFGSLTEVEAYELLKTLGFTTPTLELLRSEGRWKTGGNGIEVDVSNAIIESLSPENRAALAHWFHTNNNPYFRANIINFAGGDFSAFTSTNVSPETLELVKRISFFRENVLSLMDLPYIMRLLGDNQEEKANFLRTAFATPSLIVRLVMDDTTDVDTAARYWSSDGMNPGVESILNGVRSTSGVDKIDIVHLLPPLPRRYLNSFTNLRDVVPSTGPDCFWISLQFFRNAASLRFLDPLHFRHHIDSDFELVSDEPQFGDMVCMFNEKDDFFLHSYVYIADDIVFSKNGASLARPFVLTHKADMMSVYLDETAYRFETYRRKKGT